MNAKQKGDNTERELVELLKTKYPTALIDKAPRTMRRVFSNGKSFYVSGRNDFFGLFDICMKGEDGTCWIQVKSDISDVSKALKKIREKANYFTLDKIYVFLRVARKGWVRYQLNGEKTFYDLKLKLCESFKITKE